MDEYRDSIKSGYLQERFRLFHLKDRKDKEYTYHYHDFHKIIWFVSGKVEYHIEGKFYPLKPHDILLVRRGEIHRPFIDDREPYERYVFYVSDDFLKEHSETGSELDLCFKLIEKEQSNVIRLTPSDSGILFDTVKRLDLSGCNNEYAGEMYSRILFLKFLIELNRCCLKSADIFHNTARYDKKIVEMIHYINEHLSDDLSIEALSSNFYLSKYHMMRKFKEETGYSLHQYILEKRILASKALILSGIPATAACMECGFKDYSTFSRAFKKLLNKLPSDVS